MMVAPTLALLIPSRLPDKLLVTQKFGPRRFLPVKEIGIIVVVVAAHQVFIWPHQGVIPASPDSSHVIISPAIVDNFDWTVIIILTMVVRVWMSKCPG